MIEETKLKSVEKVITKEMVINYANTSGDQNPIHIDEEYAKNTDFKGTIVHGMFLISSISEMLIKNIGLNWAKSGKLKIKFKNPLRVGESISTKGKISKIVKDNNGTLITCEVMCSDNDGNVLISGTANWSE
jgi:Acyl dehydratase